jgi:hypothetical protein
MSHLVDRAAKARNFSPGDRNALRIDGGSATLEGSDALGLQGVAGEGHTPHSNGGSDWATYWTGTFRELAPSLLKSGHVTKPMLEDCDRRYEDPHHWTGYDENGPPLNGEILFGYLLTYR